MNATDPLLKETPTCNFGKWFQGIHWIQEANYEPQVKNSNNKWKKMDLNPSKTG